jgi:signal transduction histidine kinase
MSYENQLRVNLEQLQRQHLVRERIFFELAELNTTNLALDAFLKAAHALLCELMEASNCYVCLSNAEHTMLSYPYYVDEYQGNAMQSADTPYRKGLTEYVLRTGQPQCMDAPRFAALRASGEITQVLDVLGVSAWIGVPIKVRGTVVGVLVVKSHEPGMQYNQADVDLMAFFANHCSAAVERHYATLGDGKSLPYNAQAIDDATLKKQIELNDLKARFISMASHEFRTPLATIHGSVELLQHYQDRMPADKRRQTLEKIDDAVERMTHMLENVLVIGRTDAGQLECKPKPLAITPFCLGLLDEVRQATVSTKVRVVLDLPPERMEFMLDETLVRNIVGNLLSNAIKYSPLGGDVHFSIHQQGDQLAFVVADQGIGIPESEQAALFSSFYRASNVGSIAGTGLGLSIVKEAVTCHQGTISVRSQVGAGSEFTVILPISTSIAEDPEL